MAKKREPEADKPIRVGDVVRLRSGSERMVVEATNGSDAQVIWSDYNTKQIRRETFPAAVLRRERGGYHQSCDEDIPF